MSEEPARKSHALTWTLAITGVLVLYMLSVGPLVYLEIRGKSPLPRPHWIEAIYTPLSWLFDTPLKKPFNDYLNWWGNLASGQNPDPFASWPATTGYKY